MAVVIETTLGDITVDLYYEQRPVSCLNFLKLCKMKYYNYNLFHTIRSGFIAQTGDPTGEGSGGESIFGLLEGPNKRFFSGETMPKIRHTDTGMISMVGTDDMMIGSQFFFTLGSDLDSLDGVHCVIGEVTEGHEVLRKLNEVICDETHRPYQDVRITHTVVLEDPYNDPAGLRAPSRSPSPNPERLKGGRIAPDEEIDETKGRTAEEIQEMIEEKEAKARATILEIVGDLPDADMAPPENVLFVCKLNPVTTDEDLEIIFSRFGKIVSCEVIRDKKTGDSLQYAFIEFADKKSCEDAYFKMDNVLIDDRRIHVDFSQSVSKIKWLGKGRGVKHINEDDAAKDTTANSQRDRSKRPRSQDRDNNLNKSSHDRKRHHTDEKSRRYECEESHDKRYKHKNETDHRPRERSISRHRKEHKEGQRKKETDTRHDSSHSHKSKYSDRHDKEIKPSNSNKLKSRNTERSPRHRSRSPSVESSNRINKKQLEKEQSKDLERTKRYDEKLNRSGEKHAYSTNNSEKKEKHKDDNKSYDSEIKSVKKHKDGNKSYDNEIQSVKKNKKEEKEQSKNRKNEDHAKHSEGSKRMENHSSKSRKNIDSITDSKKRTQNHEINNKENGNSHMKRKKDDSKSIKTKKERHAITPKTPPKSTKDSSKAKSKVTKENRKESKVSRTSKQTHKKRKRSSSTSSSDTSDSSTSSSESSSSSDSDARKKMVRKKKRRHSSSSSSSSSSDSSTSSSSSSTSSDSSSSDSDSGRERKRKKANPSKKVVSRTKKK